MTKSYKRSLIKSGRLGKHKKEFKLNKGLGRGIERIDRIQRESYLYKTDEGMRYLSRDLGNANMKVIVHKFLNSPSKSFEHLTLNWL